MVHYVVPERHALAETLRRTPPDSATLSGDWTAAQLTAHLVLRERSAVELLGRLPNRRLQRIAQRQIDDLVAREPYERLIEIFDAGPSWRDARLPVPAALVWSLPPVRDRANLLEYLVHHEDVRRAAPGWTPRPLAVAEQRAVWRRLPVAARLTLRKVSVGLVLAWPSHGEIRTRRAKQGGPVVTVTGDPVELALFTFGRIDVAQVGYDDEPDDIARVRGADISI
jgi:uncharacterized protein (TIGR03085 family)